MSDTYSIYFAGDLFNHKDLIGNLLLSEAIEKESSGRYLCVVPQHLEQSTNRSIDIRNNDLSEVVKADLILLNFDGTDTRSGSERKLCIRRGVSRPWERPGEVFGEDRNHVASEEGQRVGLKHLTNEGVTFKNN
jgi:hypothetical protein